MRQWLERMTGKLARWMQGRYGQDALSRTLLVVALLILVLASLLKLSWLSLGSLLLLLVVTYRTYSRSLARRSAENAAFLKLTRPLVEGLKLLRMRWRDRKTLCYFKCPCCGQLLRVPKGKGKLEIRCKSCGEQFQRKT